jgi:hypothetical protein
LTYGGHCSGDVGLRLAANLLVRWRVNSPPADDEDATLIEPVALAAE